MINGKQPEIVTGYPHIDNVHRFWYPELGIINNTDQSMFKYLLEKTKNFDGTAITFYGEKLSYDEMKLKVLKYMKSFYHLGVKPGDTITFLMPSCPDTYLMYYAAGEVGMKRNMVDLRTSMEGIQKYINDAESEYFICLENFPVRCVKQLMDKTATKKVLVARVPFHALDKKVRPVAKVLMNFQEYGYRRLGTDILDLEDFKTFFRHVDSGIDVAAKINPADPSTYVHTSGTMSFPKTVMISDKAQNVVADQYEKSLLPFDPHDKFLAIMPPWIVYGILAFHSSFSLKMNVMPVLDPSKEKFDKIVLDTKANHVAGVPNHAITLMESKLIKPDTDLSYVKTYAIGGAAINSEKQVEVNEFLHAHVAKGMICLRGAMMNGYLNDEEETNKVIKNIEGKDWIITGDIGHFDEDGFLFITGRKKNLITAPDGFKIAPNEIESKICMHEAVKNCIVFGVKDPNYVEGDYPVAYVELKNNNISQKEKKQIFKEIRRICEENLSSYYMPRNFYCGKIVYTPMMKDDKNKMREMFEEENEKPAFRKRNIF